MDKYDYNERVAIRMDSHYTEAQAIAMTDAKKPAPTLADRIAVMAADQAKKPKHFVIHKRTDAASLAAGDTA